MAPQDHDTRTESFDALQTFLGNSTYSLSRRKLNEVMKMLRHCGTEMVIRLPKIALIGNQSSGKSSLIEAISRIKVPRGFGTCTRCPMEVSLSRSENPWHCTVSLRFEHPDNPTVYFAETDNPEHVPLIIRRAQLAILNPAEDRNYFRNLDESQCKKHRMTLAFSQDMVVIEITGVDVDVTFIDLPGIIANTDKVFLLVCSR